MHDFNHILSNIWFGGFGVIFIVQTWNRRRHNERYLGVLREQRLEDDFGVPQHFGIYYAMGYCGSGICLASHIGHQLGRKIAGTQQQPSAFEAPRFQTRPLYHGKPWFLAASVRYYQLLDRLS